MPSDSPGVGTDRAQLVAGDAVRVVLIGLAGLAIVAVVANVSYRITGGGLATLAVAAGICAGLGIVFTALSYVLDKRGTNDV